MNSNLNKYRARINRLDASGRVHSLIDSSLTFLAHDCAEAARKANAYMKSWGHVYFGLGNDPYWKAGKDVFYRITLCKSADGGKAKNRVWKFDKLFAA